MGGSQECKYCIPKAISYICEYGQGRRGYTRAWVAVRSEPTGPAKQRTIVTADCHVIEWPLVDRNVCKFPPDKYSITTPTVLGN